MTEMTSDSLWPSIKLLKSGEMTNEEYQARLSAYYRSYTANNKDKISAINKRSYQKRKTQPKLIRCEECNKDISAIYVERHQATQTHRLNLTIHSWQGRIPAPVGSDPIQGDRLQETEAPIDIPVV